jgi:hypothetical protein
MRYDEVSETGISLRMVLRTVLARRARRRGETPRFPSPGTGFPNHPNRPNTIGRMVLRRMVLPTRAGGGGEGQGGDPPRGSFPATHEARSKAISEF